MALVVIESGKMPDGSRFIRSDRLKNVRPISIIGMVTLTDSGNEDNGDLPRDNLAKDSIRSNAKTM